ncbi:acetyltransferase [Marinobacter salarius]|uniref:acetyltransferase n=1 Tax=Marinobacter salarius TaxID=1420917 RepID=UPI000F85AF7E|nr:acetyltransferase [Marinobacter salarius]AZR42381.1 putative acetyltransferase EpsM [Marinobacter salarius]
MRLAILGASGHGKVVADIAEMVGWEEVCFFDDAWPELEMNGPWNVNGDSQSLLETLNDFDGIIVSIGNNQIRAKKQGELAAAGANLITLIHPSAVISAHASIGLGSVVFANSVVNACALVGAGVIINSGAVVEHDCAIGDFAHVSPCAVIAGGATIGVQAWIGANAAVKQLISVGDASIVGMGAVVTKNVGADVTVLGIPAKVSSR